VKFEWDEKKNELNKRKHGVSFEEACEIFNDPLHIAMLDERYNYLEERWITIGQTAESELVVAANLYFDKNGDECIRIISARKATQRERSQYEG